MPDKLKDEETETRTHSLCLFGVPGITCTSNRRCANCPGAARTPMYHQRRCPLDSLERNLFSPTQAAEGKSEIDPKLLAGSSTTLQHYEETVAQISIDISEISIRDGSSTDQNSGRRARLDPGMPSPKTIRSVSISHFEIGVKRKADQPESSLRDELGDPRGDGSSCIAEWMQNKHPKLFQDPQRTERGKLAVQERTGLASAVSVEASFTTEINESAKSKGDQLDGRSDVKEHFQNKREKIFEDLRPEGELLFVPSLRYLLNDFSLDANPIVDMQEDHVQGEASSFDIRLPGIEMLIDKQGVCSCYDGIFSKNDPKEVELIAMDIEEPSIAQIEYGIEGSSSF